LRAVQIVPIDARREGADSAGRDRRRGRGSRGRDDTVGQQGGFQHGQKRIV